MTALITLAAGAFAPGALAGQAPARVDHAMVYDAARSVIVMFGGSGPGDAVSLGATWTFDGAMWKRVATSGPGARDDVRLAYDAAREVVVLYGGRARTAAGVQVFTDTWEWNGTAWRRVQTRGPQPRTHAALGYDPVSRRVLLYGGTGLTDDAYNDAWCWDGDSWILRADSGPIGRYVNGMTTIADGLVLSLVYNAPETKRDGNMGLELYARDTAGWLQVAVDPVRFSPMMPISPTANPAELLLFAGWDAPDDAPATTWLLSAHGVERMTDATPGRRRGAAMAYDVGRGRVVLFGGESAAAVLSDTWEWYDGAWHAFTPIRSDM